MNVTYLDRHPEAPAHFVVVDAADDVTGTINEGVLHDITDNLPIGERAVLVTGLHTDEPVFVLRGQDALATGAIAVWLADAAPNLSAEREEQVIADFSAFLHWQRDNPDKVKLPD